MSTYLIVSANNYGNVGDDICGYSGEYIAKQVEPNSRVIVTSPPFDESLAEQADVILVSGGGIIYDRVKENVNNYMDYIEYAQKKGIPNGVIGVGVQGIVTDWGKDRYKKILNKADVVTTRSKGDKKMLDDIGVKNAVATQDLGLLADEWVKAPFFKPRVPKSPKPRLGLVPVDVRFLQAYKNGSPKLNRYIDLIEENMERLSEEFDIWLFAHSKDDADWRNELAKKYGVHKVDYENIKDFKKFYYLYQQMDLVVGVRFHSVILGLLAGVPTVGIGSTGAKLFRLNAEAPTLKKQSISLGDTAKLEELFANLKQRYDEGEFVKMPEKELKKLKDIARKNVGFVEEAVS